MGWWLGLHQPPWSFGFDSQDPLMVGIRSPAGLVVGLHQPPWRTLLKVHMVLGSSFLFLQEQIKDIIIISFGFDSLTRGTREIRAPPCVKVPGSSRVQPPANSFVIGPAVINTHTRP